MKSGHSRGEYYGEHRVQRRNLLENQPERRLAVVTRLVPMRIMRERLTALCIKRLARNTLGIYVFPSDE